MSCNMLFLYTIAIFLNCNIKMLESKLRYDIIIGAGTIVSPTATISAENGPIIIETGCVIGERVKIINRLPSNQQDNENPPVLTIGNGNVFKPDCHIEAPSIGDNNVFDPNCFVGNQVTATNGNVFGVKSFVGNSAPNGGVNIGAGNVFKPYSHVEACQTGNGNVFEPQCFVGNQVTVTNGCVITTGCKVTRKQVIKEGLVVNGDMCEKSG